MSDFWQGWLDLFFPQRLLCPFCQHKLILPALICAACRTEIDSWRRDYTPCPRCGKLVANPGGSCRHCRHEPPLFTLARAIGPYQGVLREVLRRVKYRGQRQLAPVLAALMAEVILAETAYQNIELIIPVPLHPHRLKKRQFNQVVLLAKPLGKMLNLQVPSGVLLKKRDTPAQVGLTREERVNNLAGAFQVARAALGRGKKILLVDDVYTTGSTVAECTRVLLEAGAGAVTVITAVTGIQEEDLSPPITHL